MLTRIRALLIAALLGLLVACGGGGGGDRAAGVDPGPSPSAPVTPPPPSFPVANPAPYAEAEELFASITSVTLNAADQPVVRFQLSDGSNVPVIDLAASNVRFIVAKLRGSELGNLTGNWQSYINRIESPGVGPGSVSKLQATSETASGTYGELINHGDGTYTYTFAVSLTALPASILAQAETEGINLEFEADRTHRVALQFDGGSASANPVYDWVPATGAAATFTRDIAATENCNRCHDPLALHGGNRREVEYCVTCHNAGSSDANSGNTVDMKVMIHKIHMGKNLPSVLAGGDYTIFGFRDSPHDYSAIAYPQDVRNCVNCHAGTATVGDREDLVVTSNGDNWAEVPSRAACGSCHDDVAWEQHKGGQEDDLACSNCHEASGGKLSVTYAHRQEVMQARETLHAEITAVDNTSPGEQPVVSFRISNPLTGEAYDLLNDPIFTDPDARIAVGIAWDTADYTNTGNFNGDVAAVNASQVQTDALANATPNGDGSYSVTLPVAIPDGSLPPGVRASGSGIATVEGHPIFDLDANNDGETELTSVPVGDAHKFFSIDEANGAPQSRRASVELEKCLGCHQTLALHGDNRADNIDSCVSCHNPRNTDRSVREAGRAQATDGKGEESLDFKSMIHGIHAAAMREEPLQVVGFGGFSVHVYDTAHVHYPGDLANCTACHTAGGFTLPLQGGVLGVTVDSGSDRNDPADDTVATPVAKVCSSCHDGTEALAHMVTNGASFATSQAAIDAGTEVEECAICHASGRDADVARVHDPH